MAVASLDLDLEVFQGPFDLLLTLVLREEVDLLEVELADVVVAYIDHLQAKGEIDLEAATEFLVLIAALLELKSRMMLPAEETDGLELEPSEAADELLARMLEYRRYRDIAGFLRERLEAESGFRYRSARLPAHLRRVSLEVAEARLRARPAGRGAGRPAARPAEDRPAPPRAPARVARAAAGARARPAAQPRHLLLRRRRPRRRPHDRGRDPVRAAGAVQVRRGQLGPERAVRADHDHERGKE